MTSPGATAVVDEREKLRQAGIPAHMDDLIVWIKGDDFGSQVDAALFRNNPDRSHLIRPALPDEVEKAERGLRLQDEPHPPPGAVAHVVVRRVDKSTLLKQIIWFAEIVPDDEATAHAIFDTAVRNEKITTVEAILARQVKPGKH